MNDNKTTNFFQRMANHGAIRMTVVVILVTLVIGIVGIVSDGETVSFSPEKFMAESQQIPQLSANTQHGQLSIEYVRILSDDFYYRFPFSYREMHSAAWIVDVLLTMGYTWDEIAVQEFLLDDSDPLGFPDFTNITELYYFLDDTPFINFNMRASRQSQNVILTVEGQSDEVIIVGAHYDTVMVPGASDNASGVALLLESAHRMRYIDNYYTIVYIFFGAEESGLHGAFYYANSLTEQDHDNILFMLNADVLLEGSDLFYMAGYLPQGVDLFTMAGHGDHTRPGTNHITKAWDNIAESLYGSHGITLIPIPEGVYGPSDQLAFLPFGHTAMFMAGLTAVDGWYNMVNFSFSSALSNMVTVLHTPLDNFHHINATWPDRMETAMFGFSVFLEELLLADYSS